MKKVGKIKRIESKIKVIRELNKGGVSEEDVARDISEKKAMSGFESSGVLSSGGLGFSEAVQREQPRQNFEPVERRISQERAIAQQRRNYVTEVSNSVLKPVRIQNPGGFVRAESLNFRSPEIRVEAAGEEGIKYYEAGAGVKRKGSVTDYGE